MVLVLSRATRADEKWRANFQGEIKSQHLSRLSNHNVPPGSSENPYGEARSAEFDGTGGTGWTVDQKGSLKFFILCRYTDKVYTYLYAK